MAAQPALVETWDQIFTSTNLAITPTMFTFTPGDGDVIDDDMPELEDSGAEEKADADAFQITTHVPEFRNGSIEQSIPTIWYLLRRQLPDSKDLYYEIASSDNLDQKGDFDIIDNAYTASHFRACRIFLKRYPTIQIWHHI